MHTELEILYPIFSLSTHGSKCKSCVIPRLLRRELRDWDHEQHGSLRDAIEEHIESRCGACQDSVSAEHDEEENHYVISIYQRE